MNLVLLGIAALLFLLGILNEFGDAFANADDLPDDAADAHSQSANAQSSGAASQSQCSDGSCRKPHSARRGPVMRLFHTFKHYLVNTSNPLLQMLFSLIVHGGFGVYFVQGYQFLPAHSFHRYSSPVVFGACLVSFFAASFTAPGKVTRPALAARAVAVLDLELKQSGKVTTCADNSAAAPPPPLLSDASFDGALSHPGLLCAPCGGLPRPPGSKHCHLCAHCVPSFDHHCVWINACVGARNRRFFLAFLFTHALLTTYGSYVMECVFREIYAHHGLATATYAHPTTGAATPLTAWTVTRFFAQAYPALWALCILIHVMGVVVALFAGFHGYLLLTGRTTHGDIVAHRAEQWGKAEAVRRDDAAAVVAAAADAAMDDASGGSEGNSKQSKSQSESEVKQIDASKRAAAEADLKAIANDVEWMGGVVGKLVESLAAAQAEAKAKAKLARSESQSRSKGADAETETASVSVANDDSDNNDDDGDDGADVDTGDAAGAPAASDSVVRDRRPTAKSNVKATAATKAKTKADKSVSTPYATAVSTEEGKNGCAVPGWSASPWPLAQSPAALSKYPLAVALIEKLARAPMDIAAARPRSRPLTMGGATVKPAVAATVSLAEAAAAGCVPGAAELSPLPASPTVVPTVSPVPTVTAIGANTKLQIGTESALCTQTESALFAGADWPTLLQQPSIAFLTHLLPTVVAADLDSAPAVPAESATTDESAAAQTGIPIAVYSRLLLASSAAAVATLAGTPVKPELDLDVLSLPIANNNSNSSSRGKGEDVSVNNKIKALLCTVPVSVNTHASMHGSSGTSDPTGTTCTTGALSARATALVIAACNLDWSILYDNDDVDCDGSQNKNAEEDCMSPENQLRAAAAFAVAAAAELLWGEQAWARYTQSCSNSNSKSVESKSAEGETETDAEAANEAEAETAATVVVAGVTVSTAAAAVAARARQCLSYPFSVVPAAACARAARDPALAPAAAARRWPQSVLPVLLRPWDYWAEAVGCAGRALGHPGDEGVVANVRRGWGGGALAELWPEF